MSGLVVTRVKRICVLSGKHEIRADLYKGGSGWGGPAVKEAGVDRFNWPGSINISG